MILTILNKITDLVVKTKGIANFGLLIFLVYGCFQVLIWYKDDAPPVTIIRSEYTPPIYSGYPMNITWHVNFHRFCNVSTKRWIQDSAGARFHLNTVDYSKQDLKDLHSVTPNKLQVLINLPAGLKPGLAIYNVKNSFSCNTLQNYFPLIVNGSAIFTIENTKSN